MNRTLLVLVVSLPAAIAPPAARGQEPAATGVDEAAAEPGLPPRRPVVRELAPELFYLRDDSGRLVPVPGFRYRDFLELFRIKEGLAGPAAPPPAILESVVARIDARGLAPDAASCPVEVTARVRQSRGGWAMVPLELPQLLPAGPPRHEGPGRMLVDADPEGGGFRCWFEPPPDAGTDVRHTVTLTGRLPVSTGEARESFAVRLPVAVASRLELRTDRDDPRLDVRPPAAGRVETKAVEGGSLATVTGLSGDVRIRVEGAGGGASAAVAAEAECRSVVRIDGRTATITATLALANLPPGTKRLRIGLPARARLRRVGGDGSLVSGASGTDAQEVTVAVERGPDGAAEIEIECELTVDPSGGTPLDPVGFAVENIDAWRQRGRILLVVAGDWQATWDDMPDIRRVDTPAGDRPAGFVAAFAYDAQRPSLPLRIRPRQSRVVIEPEYRYRVTASRIALDARLRVAVRGGPIGSVAVALDPVWRLGDVGPAGIVDAAGVRTEAGLVTIPFLQPLAGDAVVELEAACEIDTGSDRLAWRLPVPQGDLIGPAAVIVSSDADIELLPDPDGIGGLVRQTSSALPTDSTDTTALVYRLDGPGGQFAAARRFLPRRVEAVVSGTVAVDEREIEVAETIRLDVLHVPLEFLELSLARELVDAGTMDIRQDNELLEAFEIDALDDVDSAGRQLALVRVLLAEPLLGRGEVAVRFRLPTPPILPEATAAVDLPLALPVVGGTIRQAVSIEESPTLAIVPRDDSWRREVSGQPGGSRSWWTSKPRQVLPLAISARSREAAGVTVIEAAWLRTRLFPERREDDFAFVVTPAGPRLELRIPSAPGAVSLEARLDGAAVPLLTGGDDRFAIDLQPAGTAVRLLEIRSTAAWGGTVFGLGLPWPLRLEAPTFAEDAIQRRFCWEVAVLPGDHLLAMPLRWTAQQRWRWRGFGWRREPAVSSIELSEWIDQTLARPAVGFAPAAWPLREQRETFAGIGPPGSASAWVVPTWLIVFVASGLTLGFGLVAATRPAWRSPPAVLAALAGITILAAAAPEAAPLLAQAAAPGAVLAGLAAVLRRLAQRGEARPWRPIAGPASSLTRTHAPTASLIVASSVDSTSKATMGSDGP